MCTYKKKACCGAWLLQHCVLQLMHGGIVVLYLQSTGKGSCAPTLDHWQAVKMWVPVVHVYPQEASMLHMLMHGRHVAATPACTRGSVCALRVVRDLHQPVPSALRTAADTWLHACAAHPNHCGCLLVYLQASMLRVAMLGCKLSLLVEVRGSEQLPAIAARPWSLR